MEEKLNVWMNEQFWKFSLSDEMPIDFITRIYYAGCAAQSIKDREAIVEQWKSIHTFPLWFEEHVVQGFKAALATAAIVEEK